MRTIVLVAAALAALSVTSVNAGADGAWCTYDSKGGTNCGFHSYAQCAANLRGIGGSCAPNPAFQGSRGSQPSVRDSRRRTLDY